MIRDGVRMTRGSAQDDKSVTRIPSAARRAFGGRVKFLRLVTCTFIAPSWGHGWVGRQPFGGHRLSGVGIKAEEDGYVLAMYGPTGDR